MMRVVTFGFQTWGHRTLSAVLDAGHEVTLAVAGGEPVDAGSALMIMTLGAEQGVEVTVESADQGTVDAIAALVAQDLDA